MTIHCDKGERDETFAAFQEGSVNDKNLTEWLRGRARWATMQNEMLATQTIEWLAADRIDALRADLLRRMTLTDEEHDGLYTAIEKTRSTVKVDKAALSALLRDYSRLMKEVE